MRMMRSRRKKKKRGRQESEGEQAWKNRHCLRQREEDRERRQSLRGRDKKYECSWNSRVIRKTSSCREGNPGAGGSSG